MLSSLTSFSSSIQQRILSLLIFLLFTAHQKDFLARPFSSMETLLVWNYFVDQYLSNAAVDKAPLIPMLLTLGDKSFIVTNPWLSSPSKPSPSRTNKGRLRRRTKYKLRLPTAKSEAIPVAMNAEDEPVVTFCVQASWSSIRTSMVTNLINQEFAVASSGTSNSSSIVYTPALPHSDPSVVEIRSQILPPLCVYS